MMRTLVFILPVTLIACAGDQPLGDGHLSVKPSITAVSPPIVPTSGGTEVTIIGKNLPADATVTVNGAPAPGADWRDTDRITFVSPPLPFGSYDITVRADGEDLVATHALRTVASEVGFDEVTTPLATWPVDQEDWISAAWRTGDLDGDGLDDAVVYHDNHDLIAYLSDGVGGNRVLTTLHDAVRPIALVDVDGDHRADLVDRVSLRLSAADGFASTIKLADVESIVGAVVIVDGGQRTLFVMIAGKPFQIARVTLGGGSATVTPLALQFTPAFFYDTIESPLEPLATLDFDGDGHTDLAYLAGDRAVVLRGPDFTDSITVPGAYERIQGRATDLDHDGHDDLVLADEDHVTVAFDRTGAALDVVAAAPACPGNEDERAFVPAAAGVATDLIGVQCVNEMVVLGWRGAVTPLARVPHRIRITSTVDAAGKIAPGDRLDAAMPRFVHLAANAAPAIVYLDYNQGRLVDLWMNQWGNFTTDWTFISATPFLAEPLELIPGRFGGRVIGYTPTGLVARTPGTAAIDRVTVLDAGEDVFNLHNVIGCDVDGDGIDEVIVGAITPGGSQTFPRVVKVDASGLSLSERLPAIDGINHIVVGADLEPDHHCDVVIDPGPNERAWKRDEGGWHEITLPAIAPSNARDGDPPSHVWVADIDGDGDDDLVGVGSDGRVWIGEARPGPAIAWRGLDYPSGHLSAGYHVGSVAAAHGTTIAISESAVGTPQPARLVRGHADGDAFVIDGIGEAKPSTNAGGIVQLSLVDIDGDGVDDVIGADIGAVFLARTLPDGSLGPIATMPLPHMVASFAVTDLDGDGLADLGYRVSGILGVFWSRNVSR